MGKKVQQQKAPQSKDNQKKAAPAKAQAKGKSEQVQKRDETKDIKEVKEVKDINEDVHMEEKENEQKPKQQSENEQEEEEAQSSIKKEQNIKNQNQAKKEKESTQEEKQASPKQTQEEMKKDTKHGKDEPSQKALKGQKSKKKKVDQEDDKKEEHQEEKQKKEPDQEKKPHQETSGSKDNSKVNHQQSDDKKDTKKVQQKGKVQEKQEPQQKQVEQKVSTPQKINAKEPVQKSKIQQPSKQETPSKKITPQKGPKMYNLKNEQYPIKVILNDFLKLEKDKETMKIISTEDLNLRIQETFPLFILNDGHYFMSAVLTNEVWEKFQKNVLNKNNIMFHELRNVRLQIKKFSLQLRQVNPKEIFTSFCGLEVRMIIHEANLLINEKYENKRFTNSVFKDDEIRTLILNIVHKQMKTYMKSQDEDEFLDIPNIFSKNKDKTTIEKSCVYIQEDDEDQDMDEDDGNKRIFFSTTFPYHLKEKLELMEIQDIIVDEKGEDYLNTLIENRKQQEIERKQKELNDQKQWRTPPKYQQYTRGHFSGADQSKVVIKHNTKKQKNELNVAAEDLNATNIQVRGLQQYKVKDVKIDKIAAKSTSISMCFNEYKRFIQWFRDNMIEGLENKQQQQLQEELALKQNDNIKRDMTDFYSQDHDFSIVLMKRIHNSHSNSKSVFQKASEQIQQQKQQSPLQVKQQQVEVQSKQEESKAEEQKLEPKKQIAQKPKSDKIAVRQEPKIEEQEPPQKETKENKPEESKVIEDQTQSNVQSQKASQVGKSFSQAQKPSQKTAPTKSLNQKRNDKFASKKQNVQENQDEETSDKENKQDNKKKKTKNDEDDEPHSHNEDNEEVKRSENHEEEKDQEMNDTTSDEIKKDKQAQLKKAPPPPASANKQILGKRQGGTNKLASSINKQKGS